MQLKVIIDETQKEEIIIRAHSESPLVKEIQKLVSQNNLELVGYKNSQAVLLNLLEVNCFICESNKIYALTDEKLNIKLRLYQIEEKLDDNFIKINQSCIANIKQIERVQATFSGSMAVIFKNGYTDYISRRNLKKVKERIGVKL